MNDLVIIKVIDRLGEIHEFEAPGDIGISLMELCKANDLPILATCGGMALCATCHVYIESNNDLGTMGSDEELMLDQVPNFKNNSRLSCQIPVNESCAGLIARIAED